MKSRASSGIFRGVAPSARRLRIDFLKFIGVSGVLLWIVLHGAEQLGYHWQWYRVPQYLFVPSDDGFSPGPLLTGLLVTLQITAVSLFCALVTGLTAALMAMSRSFAAQLLSRVYLELIRNTPLLIQLFFIYFIIAPVLDLSAFTSAVLALSLFEGAYASEMIRAGIQSVPQGQWDAARSLGMTRWQCYRYIVLPQAIRTMLPPLAGQGVSLVKDSALVSTIAIYDLTMQAQIIISETFLAFEIWFTIAAIYLIITLSLSFAVSKLEYHLKHT